MGKDSIWAANGWFGAGGVLGPESVVVENLRMRRVAEEWIVGRILAHQAAGPRVLVGFDFPFSNPADWPSTPPPKIWPAKVAAWSRPPTARASRSTQLSLLPGGASFDMVSSARGGIWHAHDLEPG